VIKNFQIIKYDNNIIVNVYQLNNTFKLIDINSEVFPNNILINDLISKLYNISDDIEIDSTELKLFIPVTVTETVINDNKIDDNNEDEITKLNNIIKEKDEINNKLIKNLDKLEDTIDKLKSDRQNINVNDKKENEEKELENIKKL
jgi:hypothetical protein